MSGVNTYAPSMRLHGVDVDGIISSMKSDRTFMQTIFIVFRETAPCGIFILLTWKYRIIAVERLVKDVNLTDRGVNAGTVPELAWDTE